MTPANTTPDVGQLRAEFARAYENCSSIGRRSAEIRERLPKISDEEIPVAIANGEFARAEELRAERTALEAEWRDLEKAERIASARAAAADRDLARAELPGLLDALTATAATFRRTLGELQRTARTFDAQRATALARFGIAGLGGKTSPSNPERVSVGAYGWQILKSLRDITTDLGGE